MGFGTRKGWSDCIRGVRAREILEAVAFAEKIGRKLNVCADINWSKTSAGDDPTGKYGAGWRKAAGRWLRQHGGRCLTGIYARECPDAAVRRPNTHHTIYVPMHLYGRFRKAAPSFLPKGVRATEVDAVYVQLIMPPDEDHRRRYEYVLKGTHKRARVPMKQRRSPQGRIYGKRTGTSEDIGSLARARAAESAAAALVAAFEKQSKTKSR